MSKKIIAIVPAAGVGQRAQRDPADQPKQYRLLQGKPMLRWAVEALLADSRVDQVRVAVSAADPQAAAALQGLDRTVFRPCGGPSRAHTVLAALEDADLAHDDWVLVHDAARPGLPLPALSRLIDVCLAEGQGALLAQPVPDTVKRAGAQPVPETCVLTGAAPAAQPAVAVVAQTVSRGGLWLAQTPQMFQAGVLLRALQAALQSNKDITDEASAVELLGVAPRLVAGSVRNFKVTWPEDFELMEKWL